MNWATWKHFRGEPHFVESKENVKHLNLNSNTKVLERFWFVVVAMSWYFILYKEVKKIRKKTFPTINF